MSSPSARMERYIISAHPYLFDVRFRALRWCASGHVALKDIYGGVHEARAVIEADEQGYLALKAAGFTVQHLSNELCPASEDTIVLHKKKVGNVGIG